MLLARTIIVQPKRWPAKFQFQSQHPLTEFTFDFSLDEHQYHINAVHLKATESKGLVFFLHGTLNHIQYHLPKADIFIQHNYDVVIMDYPTYGKSKGRLTEDLLHRVVETTYHKSLEALGYSGKVILVGRSLGTALASNLAIKIQPEKLVLISPYYNMPDLFQHKVKLFPFKRLKFKLENDRFLKDVTCETFIFHGSKDKLIPIKLSKRLIPLLKTEKNFIEIPDADHFNVHETELYQKMIKNILI
ncbi:MAG: alpha/beta hydrolase [Chitinophagales bacterium]